eukprot:774750-Rhodomonas_salina.2
MAIGYGNGRMPIRVTIARSKGDNRAKWVDDNRGSGEMTIGCGNGQAEAASKRERAGLKCGKEGDVDCKQQ